MLSDNDILDEFNKNYCIRLSKKFNITPRTIRKALGRAIVAEVYGTISMEPLGIIDEESIICEGAWMKSNERIISKQLN